MDDVPHGPAEASDFVAEALARKPDLVVYSGDLTAAARALRDLFAASGRLFDRGIPVKPVREIMSGAMVARPLTVESVVHEAHRAARPIGFKKNRDGPPEEVPITLPGRVARLYLDMEGEWNLPPLNGITSAPMLSDDGSIYAREGYDEHTGLWCEAVPTLPMPPTPSMPLALAALCRIRETFRTFPFADAPRVWDPTLGVDVVDITKPPGGDESAFLVCLTTAVCRPSLWLAPGLLLVAPQISGAGTGKGLVARAICIIAFGQAPQAFTGGHNREELEKRISAELIEAGPALFLDNVNNVALKSDTLSSAITERPARVRDFGKLRMLRLNSSAFVVVTGNGLTVSEDLARRFILVELDAKMEDPEERPFEAGFLDSIRQRRGQLLADVLTIWRWGRQNRGTLKQGKPLGSFEMWTGWVRDPLLTLGCVDPVARISEVKDKDHRRRRIADILSTWWERHGKTPVKAAELHEDVRAIIDPQGRGRQYLVAALDRMVGARVGGMVLTAERGEGKWSITTYAVQRTDSDGASGEAVHRDHRGHRRGASPSYDRMTPMPPTRDDVGAAADVPPGGETVL